MRWWFLRLTFLAIVAALPAYAASTFIVIALETPDSSPLCNSTATSPW